MSRWPTKRPAISTLPAVTRRPTALLAEVKLGDRNFLGTGKNAQAAFTYGQYGRGIDLSASEPYFLGTRVAAGIELFGRQNDASPYQSYGSDIYGATLQLGTPLTEQIGVQWRYSLYNQNVTLDPASLAAAPSLPVRQAAPPARNWVSAAGSTVDLQHAGQHQEPDQRHQFATQPGSRRPRRRREIPAHHAKTCATITRSTSDLVGLVRAQGGYITGWGGQQVPLMNSFFGGPTMVRGFAPNGFGPRDLTPGTTMDNVGGSMYWATTAELQSTIPGVPKEYGLKATAFVDAGSVFRYSGPTAFPGSAHRCRSPTPMSCAPRSAPA